MKISLHFMTLKACEIQFELPLKGLVEICSAESLDTLRRESSLLLAKTCEYCETILSAPKS